MKNLYIEIADTHMKREYGLMDRKSLGKNTGMLFKYNYSSALGFWMKNTYIPLHIAFIDDSGKIFQIEEMVPLSTRAIVSNKHCRYALEVNKNWFKDNDVQIGASVKGYGIDTTRTAQETLPQVTEMPSMNQPSDLPFGDVQPDLPAVPPLPDADVMLNKSYKEILEDANLRGKNLIIIYQTKRGITLPPKSISPPFSFEQDEDGKHDAIVKVWDNQTGGWKSLIIDNILRIDDEEKEEKEAETQEI